MREFVPLQQLAVVNFQTKHFNEDIRAWKESADIASAMSCSRQIWFGTKNDFADFPRLDQTRTGVTYYEGAEAYKFMVRLVLGVDSKNVSEDNIKGQVFGCWDQYQTTDITKKKLLDRIMQDIKADSRYVDGAVLSGFKHQRHEIAARDLSGQQKDDTILLVGTSNRHGKLSNFTDGIARVTGNKRGNAASEIIVTHPDSQIRYCVFSHLCDMKGRGLLKANISRVPFSDFCQAVEKSDRVYVDMPMGSNQQAEEHMVLAWQTRIYQGNTLTHLRGNPDNMGYSTSLWEQADLNSYTSPEMIRADMAARSVHNRKILEEADKTVAFCAQLRADGGCPSNSKVRDYVTRMRSVGNQEAMPILAAA